MHCHYLIILLPTIFSSFLPLNGYGQDQSGEKSITKNESQLFSNLSIHLSGGISALPYREETGTYGVSEDNYKFKPSCIFAIFYSPTIQNRLIFSTGFMINQVTAKLNHTRYFNLGGSALGTNSWSETLRVTYLAIPLVIGLKGNHLGFKVGVRGSTVLFSSRKERHQQSTYVEKSLASKSLYETLDFGLSSNLYFYLARHLNMDIGFYQGLIKTYSNERLIQITAGVSFEFSNTSKK